MQARRLRRQRRRRSKMSNNPVTPWNELEGRFFKVDVGSTTAEAITNDHQTGEPVVHYTTDGDIVFNGMKFCQQGGVKRFNKLIVHKTIPMTPEKGNFYYFYDGWVKFKVDLDRMDDSAVFRFPSIKGFIIKDEYIVAYPNRYVNGGTTTAPFIIENIEGKTVAEIKKIMSSKIPYANRFLLIRYIQQYKGPVIITTTRNVNLFDNTEIAVLDYIMNIDLHKFMMERGCCFASNDYKISDETEFDNKSGKAWITNNRVVYCAIPNVPREFKDYWSFLFNGNRNIKTFRYKRKRKFYHKTENGIRKRFEVTKNGRKTYFLMRTNIYAIKSTDNFSFTAYLKKYREGGPASTEEVKVIIWNDNGVVKIKKF